MNEYLKKLIKALAEKNLAMQTLLSKSEQAGTTPDEATEAEIVALEKEIAEIEKKLNNLLKAIEAGVLTETTMSRMQELEEKKKDKKA